MGFVPTVLAIGVVAIMLQAKAPDGPLTLSALNDAVNGLGLGGGGIIIAAAAAVSITLAPLQFRLVQCLEATGHLLTDIPHDDGVAV